MQKTPRGLGAARWMAGWTAAALTLAHLANGGCARNPVSGRPEPVLTTEKREIEQGEKAAKEVEEQVGFVEDTALARYVDEIGQRLAAHSPRQNLEYHFHVVEMKEANAFALPGGHIYVSRGLLALLNSEDELANVIGHELAHVAARHAVSRQAAYAPLIPVQIAAGLAGAAAGIVAPGLGNLIAGIGSMPGALAIAKYSRDQEREADALGQQYAAASGWDPAALATFMHTLGRDEALQGRDPNRVAFFESHPNSPERAEDAEKHATTLAQASEPAPLDRSAFLEKIDGIVIGEGVAEGTFVDERFMQPELDIGMSLPRAWKLANTPAAVIAQKPDGSAYIVLEIFSEGDDPEAAVNDFRKDNDVRGLPRTFEVNGLPAVEIYSQTDQGGQRSRVHMTWIAQGEKIYRITGTAPAPLFEEVLPEFRKSARSFHTLGDEEREEILENRLRFISSIENETVEEITERSGSQWSPELCAIANALELGEPVEPDRLIKISRREVYRSPPPEESASQETAQAEGG